MSPCVLENKAHGLTGVIEADDLEDVLVSTHQALQSMDARPFVDLSDLAKDDEASTARLTLTITIPVASGLVREVTEVHLDASGVHAR